MCYSVTTLNVGRRNNTIFAFPEVNNSAKVLQFLGHLFLGLLGIYVNEMSVSCTQESAHDEVAING